MRSLPAGWQAPVSAAPLVVLAAVAALDAVAGGHLVSGPATVLVLIAAAAAGLWSSARLVGSAVLVASPLLTLANQVADPGAYGVADDLVFSLVMTGCPALVAAGWGARGREMRQLRRLAAVRAAQVKAHVDAARFAETNRIAGAVLQDVVQTLVAVLLRARAAADPDALPGKRSPVEAGHSAREALADIEVAARSLLDHLRAHVGVLRDPTAAPGPRPQPGPEPGSSSATPALDGADRPAFDRGDVLAALTVVPITVDVLVTSAAIGPVWAAALAPLVLAVPLAARRRRPLPTLTAFVALSITISFSLVPLGSLVTPILPLLLMAHAVGAHVRTWRDRVIGLALLVVGAIGLTWATDTGAVLGMLLLAVISCTAGIVTAARTSRVQTLEELVHSIERHREDEVLLATARQRLAIARDLHDSVAAAATIICLQASAGQTLAEDDDAQVREVLNTIAVMASDAIGEVRASLHLLDAQDSEPHPAGDVDAVVAAARRAGVDVVLDPPAPSLPGGVNDVVVRIVREGLVNASRYAPGAHVVVSLAARDGYVEVRVVDDGAVSAPVPGSLGTGTGLVGLAERLASCGGGLSYGPRRSRGYEVSARVPLAESDRPTRAGGPEATGRRSVTGYPEDPRDPLAAGAPA